MGLWYSFRVALRALAVNKGRTILTALGVIIGVSAVITMVGLGQGFGNAITKQINANGANWMYLGPGQQNNGPGPSRPGKLTIEDIDALRRQYPDLIKHLVPVSMGAATVKYRSRSSETSYSGSTEDYLELSNMPVAKGTFLHKHDIDGRVKVCVLGAKVVSDLTGSPTTDLNGKTVYVNRDAFTVLGVLKSKGQFLGNNQDDTIIIPISTAMHRMQSTENVTYCGIQANDKTSSSRLLDATRRTLRARHNVKPPYGQNDDFSIQTEEGAMEQVGQVTGIISMLLGSVAAISLFVGGIGIMNIMLVSVTERTREIGLRKAIGATVSTILSQFLIESVMVSVLGGLVGIGFGLVALFGAAAAINANTAVQIDSAVSPSAVLIAFAVSATIGVVFGIYPAWRAARLDPITALRYE